MITLELTRDMHLMFKVLAHKYNTTMTALVIMLVGDFVRRMQEIDGAVSVDDTKEEGK